MKKKERNMRAADVFCFFVAAAAAGLNSALRVVRRGVCYATPFPFDWTFNINSQRVFPIIIYSFLPLHELFVSIHFNIHSLFFF